MSGHRVFRRLQSVGLSLTFAVALAISLLSQEQPQERIFSQPKSVVDLAVRKLDTPLSGRLPTLAGFAISDHSLDAYKRGYYQANITVSGSASGGTLVRVTTKITAYYTDAAPSKSGYQTLRSNGRLESDILDQLADQLSGNKPTPSAAPHDQMPPAALPPAESVPSAPVPQKTDSAPIFSSSKDLAPETRSALQASIRRQPEDDPQLASEAKELSEIIRNQVHPANLIAIKKGATPVFSTPDINGKPLFYASEHDEFELLDFNVDWIHVRISGLSRGWIWRNSAEMPDNFAASDQPQATQAPHPFHITREETAPFPGDWAPLRGKIVKVITVQKTDEKTVDTTPEVKLEYTKALFDKNYNELSKATQELSGVVLIFDAADGGMVAATADSLKQWESGALTDSALWRKCFFDPPETFDVSASPATR